MRFCPLVQAAQIIPRSSAASPKAPGPLQVIVPSVPNATAGIYPNVMVPAFAVPSSILLHVLSLRQLRRCSR
jgi:hypothetical protein